MEYTYFRYPPIIRVMHFGGYLAALIMLCFIPYVLVHFQIYPLELLKDAENVMGLLIMLGFLFAYYISIGLILFIWPSIRTNDQGLEIKFYFWWLRVAWKDMKTVRKLNFFFYHIHIVLVKKLTPFHYLYGLIMIHQWVPCFLISSFLPGHDQLVSEIHRHVH